MDVARGTVTGTDMNRNRAQDRSIVFNLSVIFGDYSMPTTAREQIHQKGLQLH